MIKEGPTELLVDEGSQALTISKMAGLGSGQRYSFLPLRRKWPDLCKVDMAGAARGPTLCKDTMLAWLSVLAFSVWAFAHAIPSLGNALPNYHQAHIHERNPDGERGEAHLDLAVEI